MKRNSIYEVNSSKSRGQQAKDLSNPLPTIKSLWSTQFCQILTNPVYHSMHKETIKYYHIEKSYFKTNDDITNIKHHYITKQLSPGSLKYGIYGDSIID